MAMLNNQMAMQKRLSTMRFMNTCVWKWGIPRIIAVYTGKNDEPWGFGVFFVYEHLFKPEVDMKNPTRAKNGFV